MSGERALAGVLAGLIVLFVGAPAKAEQWNETWKPAPARWFIATKIDLGFAFFRPRVSLGYGKPHHKWGGLDVNPLVSTSSGGGYTGLRWDTRFFEVRSGFVYLQNFSRSLLAPRQSYDRRDINTRIAPNAEYVAWDSEVEVKVPVGPLRFVAEGQLFYLLNVQEGFNVFVDPLAVVMAPDWALRQSYSLHFPMTSPEGLVLGPAVEPIWVPGRGIDAWIWRAGLTARWPLYDDVELRTNLLPVVMGPDSLGREGSHFLELKLRWYWATH